ncbi:MAG: hypothetical protein RL754_432 [Bacteroidota bacterium]|jgi:uncharacterized protein YyaL (SSP411 family)
MNTRLTLFFLSFTLSTCTVDLSTNELNRSSSLYLQQHASNPVHWKMWSDELLEMAQKEKKLLVISIGYSSCHWCHVMEHESFEDLEVASLMNANYISIKIDREERPDLDARYMNAIQLMTGQGGWPLNVVALPDGTPVWGGTYFTKQDWMAALEQIAALWKDSPDQVLGYGEDMRSGLAEMVEASSQASSTSFTKTDLEDVLVPWMRNWDMELGGGKHAPKFPMPTNYRYLLDYGLLTEDSTLQNYVYLTLDRMAMGGIYDWVGGGMTRYSTDRFWKLPHFEKMLYDNAQLLTLYAQAFRSSQKPLYGEVLSGTQQWLRDEMLMENGLYAAALDADSKTPEHEREEGGFYTWSMSELEALNLPEFQWFKDYFDIGEYTAWEGKYILHRSKTDAQFTSEKGIDSTTFHEVRLRWMETLQKARIQRLASHPRPMRDPKGLTAWNAMLVEGFVEAHWALPESGFDLQAQSLMDVMIKQLRDDDGNLYHQAIEDEAQGQAFLDDYVTFGIALIRTYELTSEQHYLDLANSIATQIYTNFPTSGEGPLRYYDGSAKQDWQRHVEIEDNVIPSSNALLAEFLFLLSDHLGTSEYAEQAKAMVRAIHPRVFRYGQSYSNWLRLALRETYTHKEVVVSGPEAALLLRELVRNSYVPNTTLAWSSGPSELPLLADRHSTSRTRFYICEGRACKLPTTVLDQAKTLWKN